LLHWRYLIGSFVSFVWLSFIDCSIVCFFFLFIQQKYLMIKVYIQLNRLSCVHSALFLIVCLLLHCNSCTFIDVSFESYNVHKSTSNQDLLFLVIWMVIVWLWYCQVLFLRLYLLHFDFILSFFHRINTIIVHTVQVEVIWTINNKYNRTKLKEQTTTKSFIW
jgi:hypothetical protein